MVKFICLVVPLTLFALSAHAEMTLQDRVQSTYPASAEDLVAEFPLNATNISLARFIEGMSEVVINDDRPCRISEFLRSDARKTLQMVFHAGDAVVGQTTIPLQSSATELTSFSISPGVVTVKTFRPITEMGLDQSELEILNIYFSGDSNHLSFLGLQHNLYRATTSHSLKELVGGAPTMILKKDESQSASCNTHSGVR